jgi:hypothetical protein
VFRHLVRNEEHAESSIQPESRIAQTRDFRRDARSRVGHMAWQVAKVDAQNFRAAMQPPSVLDAIPLRPRCVYPLYLTQSLPLGQRFAEEMKALVDEHQIVVRNDEADIPKGPRCIWLPPTTPDGRSASAPPLLTPFTGSAPITRPRCMASWAMMSQRAHSLLEPLRSDPFHPPFRS